MRVDRRRLAVSIPDLYTCTFHFHFLHCIIIISRYTSLQPALLALTGTASERRQRTLGAGDSHLGNIVLHRDVRDLAVLLRKARQLCKSNKVGGKGRTYNDQQRSFCSRSTEERLGVEYETGRRGECSRVVGD